MKSIALLLAVTICLSVLCSAQEIQPIEVAANYEHLSLQGETVISYPNGESMVVSIGDQGSIIWLLPSDIEWSSDIQRHFSDTTKRRSRETFKRRVYDDSSYNGGLRSRKQFLINQFDSMQTVIENNVELIKALKEREIECAENLLEQQNNNESYIDLIKEMWLKLSAKNRDILRAKNDQLKQLFPD